MYVIWLFNIILGQMKKLSDEQKRIEELHTVMNAVQPTSRSTPQSKPLPPTTTTTATAAPNAQPNQTLPSDNQSSHTSVTDNQIATRLTDPTLRLSDLNHRPSSGSEDNSAISQSYHGQIDNNFSQPSIHAMSQSTDEPFMLHQTPPRKTDKTARTSSQKAATSQNEPMAVSSPKATPKSDSPMKRSSSNGFLSSSQLSRKKVILW